MGHSWTGKVQVTHTQLPQGCALCTHSLWCHFQDLSWRGLDMGQSIQRKQGRGELHCAHRKQNRSWLPRNHHKWRFRQGQDLRNPIFRDLSKDRSKHRRTLPKNNRDLHLKTQPQRREEILNPRIAHKRIIVRQEIKRRWDGYQDNS